MWLDCAQAGTDEQTPAFCRLAVVRSIEMSGLLPWSVGYGLSVLEAHSGRQTVRQVNSLVSGPVHNGEFGCRLWLVVLKLMQVRIYIYIYMCDI
jgi:hypothetical protein